MGCPKRERGGIFNSATTQCGQQNIVKSSCVLHVTQIMSLPINKLHGLLTVLFICNLPECKCCKYVLARWPVIKHILCWKVCES